jgi:hypothetical protein
MKARSQFLPNHLGLAAFDAGCRLQMPLSVKGEGKERDDRNKNYPGHPETTQMHHTLDDTKSSLQTVKGMQIIDHDGTRLRTGVPI